MKKRSFLIILVALTLLSTILLSSILGVTKAEYFKKLSKALDFEASPDLKFQYNLYINGNKTTGVYKNSKNISQEFTKSSSDKDYLKIKIPVTEVCYYTLSFNVDFWTGSSATATPSNLNSDNDTSSRTYLSSLNKPVGCQVYSHKLREGTENFFDDTNNVTVSAATADVGYSYFYGTKATYSQKQLYETKSHSYDGYYQGRYRWQTLTPSRAENVELTFYASGQDVKDGFMVWYWDFSGLASSRNYALKLNEISIKKQEPRENLPYIEFGDTKYVNNVKSASTASTEGTNYPYRALGTYATTATFDKLVMQLNPLWDAAANGNSTPMSLSVPIKNVKANTSYKVYFDFSIAMQGSSAPYTYNSDYKSYFESDLYFKSYLHNGPVSVDSVAEHNEAIKTVTNANKVFANKEMTDYSDLMDKPAVDSNNIKLDSNHTLEYLDATTVGVGDNLSLTVKNNNGTDVDTITAKSMTHAQAMNYGVTTLGGDVHTQGLGDSLNYGVNWLNAIRHSEVNSETKIHWLTFYNTNFTFNVNNVEDLNWVWAIDGLVPTKWYRIRIDNVRIEEVVPYGSFQINGMLNIAGADREDFGLALYDTLARGNFVRSTFRYSNGTGQNYRPRGYVNTTVNNSNLLNNDVLSANNIFGAIYDAGDIIIKETEKTDKNNPLGNYVIGVRGYTAVKGGVHKYVWSADGGKTWNDMLYAPTLYDSSDTVYQESLRSPRLTTIGEPNMITKICESFVDQGFIGVKDYSNKIARYENTANKSETDPLYQQTMGDYIYVKDTLETITEGDKSHTYSKEETNGTGDFVDFVHGVDDVNSVYVYMQADLSEYKDQANLDIVFAAVPEENLNARCEILRIINYNPRPDYHTRSMSIVSDIKIKTTATATESNLTATCDANGNHNKKKFALLSGAFVNSDQYSNAPTGYGHLIETFETYDELRTTFSDIPIMNKLTVKGVAFVEGGTEKYYWSVDHGKTWTECETHITEACSKHDSLKAAFYDGTTTSSSDTAFNKNICFNCGTSGITANLIAYEGQVVDIIFAAKSNLGGPLCPVGRIDNVAVYGVNGTFYTRLHRVIIDQCILANEKYDVAKNKYAPTTPYFPDQETWLTRYDDWNIGISGYAYTIFEPNNVNVANTRLYHTEAAEIQSGGRITIDGFVVCKGGVSRYKYSLDGGKTWTVINDAGADITANTKCPDNDIASMISEAKKSDSSFTVADDGAKGDYCCYSSGTKLDPNGATEERTKYYNHAIEFNLPALPAGAERNLLVVAESTNNKLIPVLHIKLKFKYADGNTMQYGYHRSSNKDDLSRLKTKYFNPTQTWGVYPKGGFDENGNKLFNRITIPIDENATPGEYQLNFSHRLYNAPQSTVNTNKQLYSKYDSDNKEVKKKGTAKTSFYLEKTHYYTNEDINIKFSLEYASTNNSGLEGVCISIVNNGWKNSNGHGHAIYYVKGYEQYIGKGEQTVNLWDVVRNGTTNDGLPKEWWQDSSKHRILPPGRYTVYFYNQSMSMQYLEGTNTSYNNIAANKTLELTGESWILGKATVYIHDPNDNEYITMSVIHDEGEETYFSDLSRQFTYEDSNPNIEPIYKITDPYDNDEERGISQTINLTEGDIKRGYIVLDMDYTNLLADPAEPTQIMKDGKVAFNRQEENMYYKVDISFGTNPLTYKSSNCVNNIPFAGSSTGYGTTTMKIPVSEAGTYDLSFSGYLNNSVTHRGYNKGKTGWLDGLELTLNYSGAAMSVPKTVYKVGEDIPISYYTKGSVAATSPVKETGNLPWIGMYEHNTRSNPSTKEEIEAGRYYVQPDSAGVKYISTAGVKPGVYQIYLRDNSAKLFHGEAPVKYWWEYDMVEPITIVITDAENPVTNPQLEYDFYNVPHIDRQEKTGFSSGELSVNKNVFYQGDTIDITLKTGLNTDDINFWFALCPVGSDTYVTWASASYTNLKTAGLDGITGQKQEAATSGSYKIPPGKYTLYLLSSGNVVTAHKNGRICAAIDITILPSTMKTAFESATQIHSLGTNEHGEVIEITQAVTPTIVSDPFSYYTVSGQFTATQQDVERGYVIFEYDFSGLGSSVDLSFVIDKFTVTKKESR